LYEKVITLLQNSSGMSCIDISKALNKNINTVSGTLTRLKRQSQIYNNDSIWYAVNHISKIKARINDLWSDNADKAWFEGWLSGLADFNIISETDFDLLIDYINTK